MYKVLKINEPKMVATKKGEKVVVNLFLEGPDGERGCDVWGFDASRGIKVGSMLEIPKMTPREYKGKIYYSCTNKDISLGTAAVAETPPADDKKGEFDNKFLKEYWGNKDKISQRSICLSYANTLAIQRSDMSIADVLTTAETYNQWIYAEQSKEEDTPVEPIDNEIPFE